MHPNRRTRMRFTHLMSVVVMATLLSGSLARAEEKPNLLNNGALKMNSKDQLEYWKRDAAQKVTVDKENKPEGVEQSLKVEITTEGKNQGGIYQQVKATANSNYRLDA